MKANLKLVVNTHLSPNVASHAVRRQATWSLYELAPNRYQVSEITIQKKTSYGWLAAVVLVHMLGMAWLVNANATPPELKPSLPPMMVSLVSSPAPEPEVVPLVPTPPQPQPVIKKQKPIIKEKPLMPEPVASEPVAEPVAVSEAPPTPAAPKVEAKAQVVTPVITEVAQAKPEPEPVIEPPKFGVAYLNNPAPSYPPLSRRLGEEGRVLLRVLVSSKGDADTVDLEGSSGFSKLDEAAIKAVKKWRFVPAKRSNQAISAYVLVPVKFSLES
jgi:protein TonB